MWSRQWEEWQWFVGCKNAGCEALGGAYLAALAAEVGAPNGRALKDDPLTYLDALIASNGGYRTTAPPTPLPSTEELRRYRTALHAETDALAYLCNERGIARRVLQRAFVGWDGRQLIFPMFRGDELVAYKRRAPRSGAQMLNCAGKGRPWPLYPEPQEEDPWVLLVAGELDALRGRSARLPASSVTLGAGHWRADWTDALRGRRVVVCFDNNEGELARRRVEELRHAGIRARRLGLRRLGLQTPKGDLSDYLNGGGTARELREAIRGTRRAP